MPVQDSLRYPIGQYEPPVTITQDTISEWIGILEQFPSQLRSSVEALSDAQLNTPYRPDGWTIRQVVHHVVDSHLNSYVRFKWAMTEDNPVIKTYEQDEWARQHDAQNGPISMSLDLLSGLHTRWTYYLRSFTERDFARTFYHPEMEKNIRLDWLLGMYAWHCTHHLAHVKGLVTRENW